MTATALYKALIHAKVPEEVAEQAVKDVLFVDTGVTKVDFTKLESLVADTLTKADFDAFKIDFARLETRVENTPTKEDFARLETRVENTPTKDDVARSETRMLRWNIIIAGVVVAAVGLMFTGFGFVLKGFLASLVSIISQSG